MKILMLGWELPPHNSGGLGVACLNMAKALLDEGIKIDFVLPYNEDKSPVKNLNIVPAVNIPPSVSQFLDAYKDSNLKERNIKIASHNFMSIRDIQKEYVKYIDHNLNTIHPDIVHAHDWLTFEAGMKAKSKYGLPLIAHVHATEYDRAGMHSGNPLIHEIEYEGLMMADKIIAVSEQTKRLIHEKYHIPLSKISVVYNSLDEKFLKNNYLYDSNSYSYLEQLKNSGYTIVSTVGRFTVQKGLPILLESAALAIQKNPKLIFLLAGDGEQRNELLQLTADLGISKNIIFTGFVRGKRLRDIYAVSDIFVMSSVSEPFGLTALEAAHHDDALILTKQSGVSEIIWSAMKYDYWDKRKLADEIIAISNNKVLRDTLKSNMKKEYNEISWPQVAKKCIRIYNKTIRRKKS